MKKIFILISVLMCAALLVVGASAAEKVVYVASGGSGDGSSVSSPLGSLIDAFTAVKDGGTVVLTSDLVIKAATNLPDHSGKITLTSVYGGVDYRVTNNAALRYTKSARLVLGGDTVIDDFTFEIDSTANEGAVLVADFYNLKIGYGVEVVHNYTPKTYPSRMYVIGGSNNDANGNGLAAGEVCNIEILSGNYMQVTAFSRGTKNKAHYGTVNLKIGGDTRIFGTYLGAVTTGASGGTINLELCENADLHTNGLYLSGNDGVMNGDVTVTVRDSVSVSKILKYAANLHKGTKTINVYTAKATLPASLETYFDVVNTEIPKDEVTLGEVIDSAKVVCVTANGTSIMADVVSGVDSTTVKYSNDLGSFTLAIAVKDNGYTVYEYDVTESGSTRTAVLSSTKTYSGDVIYVGAKSGLGFTPESPVSDILSAYALLGNSGTIVVTGKINMTRIEAPAHSGKVTVTSVYGGNDYRESGAELNYAASVNWQIGGETVFENITFNIATTSVISAAFNPLTLDKGIKVINDYANADGNGLYLIGGHNKGTNALSEYTGNTSITVRSGHIRAITGFSRYSGARVHTGKATLTVEGDAYVRYLFGGAAQDGAISKDTEINIRDNAIVENLYVGGSEKTNVTTGEVIVNIEGGNVYEFDAIGIHTSAGKVKIYYDPRTVAYGILTMANMAGFEVISPCDDAGEHTFGDVYANPFGGNLTAHACEICGYTCLIGDAPEKVADGVVFVADGGFGDGLSPIHPFGSLEDAFTALGEKGGTVVLVDECTLPVNLEWKFGATHVSFQEPVHTGNVLVTSVYGDTDYRTGGAKLIFDGNMHYRLSGPTTFDNIVFDTVGDPTTNLIAARYNKLVFGENCEMLKNVDDGYRLWVVGGYQYFRYTDFIGVEIEDRFLDMVTPVRQKAFDYAPADLTEFTYTSGSGKTHTVTLQKDAAEAFERMFADMKKEGLYVPYPSWAFRSAVTQYGIFSESVGNLRVKGFDFDTSYLAVAKSASPAGSSEHQLGLAFDIYDERLEATYGAGNAHEHYDETDEWKWIVENGPKYGFTLRFLSDKTAVTGFIYEAWHFRYVGVEHAMAIAETDYCLEEYVAEQIGLFDRDSSVTVLGGDFYQVMGGSRGCDYLTFTGTNRVTVGEGATVENLVDVDEEVVETPEEEPEDKPEDKPEDEPNEATGDANGDGKLTLADALLTLKATAGESADVDPAVVDMNGDGEVTFEDALLVIKAILNK